MIMVRCIFGVSLALALSGLAIVAYTQAVYALCNAVEGAILCPVVQ